MIESLINVTPTGGVSVVQFLEVLGSAMGLGLIVSLVYMFVNRKEKYSRGLYDFKNNKYLYVNKGLGFSFLKIRFLSCKEILFDLLFD